MALSERIVQKRNHNDWKQKDLADMMPTSRESVSKWETGRQNVPEDLRPDLIAALDDGQAAIYMWGVATGGVYIPYLDGDRVDHHFAAMMNLTKKEIDEAEALMKEAETTVPYKLWSGSEIETINRANMELLDAASAILSLVSDNIERTGGSFTNQIRRWQKTLIDRKYVRKESL